MSDKLKVVEIFASIEGEGLRTGLPCTFIRLHGCSLQCSYCDSQYACVGDDYKEMTVDEIVQEVENYQIPHVTITGGEPLIHEHVYELIGVLACDGFEINIETNGSVDLGTLNELRAFDEDYDRIMITMDWKCITSGMTDKMIMSNLEYLRHYDVLKFVVGSKEDLDQMRDLLVKNYRTDAVVFVSPVFGKIEPKEIVEYVLDNQLTFVRTQVQLHKVIWDPNMRGV